MVFVTRNIFANEQNRGKRRCCSANFTLGPTIICIYIESIRFWFIIVTILGVGAGNWGRLAGVLSPVMRPLSTNIPRRRKQVIITVLGLNWCCSCPSHIVLNPERRSKTKTAAGHIFVSELRGLQNSSKMKWIYQHSTDPVVITVWSWH